MIKQWLNEM